MRVSGQTRHQPAMVRRDDASTHAQLQVDVPQLDGAPLAPGDVELVQVESIRVEQLEP